MNPTEPLLSDADFRAITANVKCWMCELVGPSKDKPCETHDRDLLAARNIKMLGLQPQNLIGQKSGEVIATEDVETPALVGSTKRQVKSMT